MYLVRGIENTLIAAGVACTPITYLITAWKHERQPHPFAPLLQLDDTLRRQRIKAKRPAAQERTIATSITGVKHTVKPVNEGNDIAFGKKAMPGEAYRLKPVRIIPGESVWYLG